MIATSHSSHRKIRVAGPYRRRGLCEIQPGHDAELGGEPLQEHRHEIGDDDHPPLPCEADNSDRRRWAPSFPPACGVATGGGRRRGGTRSGCRTGSRSCGRGPIPVRPAARHRGQTDRPRRQWHPCPRPRRAPARTAHSSPGRRRPAAARRSRRAQIPEEAATRKDVVDAVALGGIEEDGVTGLLIGGRDGEPDVAGIQPCEIDRRLQKGHCRRQIVEAGELHAGAHGLQMARRSEKPRLRDIQPVDRMTHAAHGRKKRCAVPRRSFQPVGFKRFDPAVRRAARDQRPVDGTDGAACDPAHSRSRSIMQSLVDSGLKRSKRHASREDERRRRCRLTHERTPTLFAGLTTPGPACCACRGVAVRATFPSLCGLLCGCGARRGNGCASMGRRVAGTNSCPWSTRPRGRRRRKS
jgi:hypothetical protein